MCARVISFSFYSRTSMRRLCAVKRKRLTTESRTTALLCQKSFDTERGKKTPKSRRRKCSSKVAFWASLEGISKHFLRISVCHRVLATVVIQSELLCSCIPSRPSEILALYEICQWESVKTLPCQQAKTLKKVPVACRFVLLKLLFFSFQSTL